MNKKNVVKLVVAGGVLGTIVGVILHKKNKVAKIKTQTQLEPTSFKGVNNEGQTNLTEIWKNQQEESSKKTR